MPNKIRKSYAIHRTASPNASNELFVSSHETLGKARKAALATARAFPGCRVSIDAFELQPCGTKYAEYLGEVESMFIAPARA